MQIESVGLTLAGRFKIFGNARFLSHQETMRTITRAIVRSGIEMVYSQGFNPHPRFSLPLPRNVGLASDDELFSMRIKPSPACNDNADYAKLIAPQLPIGFELNNVELYQKNAAYQPIEVEYFVRAESRQGVLDSLNEKIKSGEEIIAERIINEKGDTKTVNIANFLKEFQIAGDGVKVVSKVFPNGTIRPDEILKLLGIDTTNVSGLIIRKKVNWQIN
ncbi:MAG: TIGR03936 family radical SAM-associated protein [Sedimentisphaerales bacterium]